jgi:hypothetical protein
MLDFFNIPSNFRGDVQTFGGCADTVYSWVQWTKPRGVSMVAIFGVGAGGKGGNGAVGANSAAAGGGGGGSGSQSFVCLPAILIPDVLFVAVPSNGIATRVAIYPDSTINNTLLIANQGGSGGIASGATPGAAGSAGSAASIATMPLAGLGVYNLLAGQAGIIGGVAVAGGALTLPTTGLCVTGGTGGGGVPAAATAGTAGGNITGAGVLPTLNGGAAQATATSPGNAGSNGLLCGYRGLEFSMGGTGGGSSHGSATGAGLFGGNGGKGGIGCGGGGGGGCLTGGTAGIGGQGGEGQVVILAW